MEGLNNSPNRYSQNFKKNQKNEEKPRRSWDPIELDMPNNLRRKPRQARNHESSSN